MATASELGLSGNSNTRPDREILKTVAFEPTFESIRDFGTDFQENRNNSTVPAEMGKFLIYNKKIVMAPFPTIVRHSDIAGVAGDVLSPECIAAELEQADKDGIPRLGRGMLPPEQQPTDAGLFMVFRDKDGTVKQLIMADKSTDFGGAKLEVREQAVELLRADFLRAELLLAALNGISIQARK